MWTFAVCAGLVATGLAVPTVGPASAAPPAGGMSAAQAGAMVSSYGDSSGRWAGGDGSVSVLLPDGRVAWLFSDTFIGAVNADHSLPNTTGMVNNSIVVQDGGAFVSTITGGTASAPTAVVSSGVTGEFYWVGDAVVEGSTLKAVYNRYRLGGSGVLDFVHLGSALVTFALPALTVSSVTPLSYGTVAWGSSIVSSDGFTYVYGTEAVSGTAKFAHVARVPAGGLSGAWSFWNGSAWVADPAASARVLSGIGDSFGTQFTGGEYVVVTTETQIAFDPQVVAYRSASPTGPFTGPIDLFTAPDPAAGGGKPIIAYNAQLHPELAQSGKLLVSYDLNSLDVADVRADVRIYRPHFVEVTWPRPQPDPATLPAAPTGLTASTDSSGTVHLQWQGPAGVSYTVYQRDVTSGHNQFARSFTTSQTSADVGLLTTGRTYEFRVTAVNSSGEGPPSTVVSQAVTIAVPPAPTGLTATADTAGHVALAWSAVGGAWSYSVYRRDVSAGETEFGLVTSTGSTPSFTTTDIQIHQHVYEFAVTATHGGGTSAQSAPASATAFYALPGAPTGLTATANPADGTIALAWTAPAPDLWYFVYQRDVTAGETGFTRLPLPITGGPSMTAGYLTNNHTYEYKVTATTAGGEGPASNTSSATATYPRPAAPTNLSATPTNGGTVLTWTASATPNVWYNVYMRDVTAGEPAFTLLPYPVTTCCTFTGGLMTNGHTYEFKLTSTNAGGESLAPSNTVSVTPQMALPGLVTGLTATPTTDGAVTLAWTAPAPDLWYNVYQRDVTAGEAGFTKLPLPITTCCSIALGRGYNVNNHVYEYKMAATNAAGEGPLSTVVSATAHYNPPPAPTNLRGRSTGDGNITLEWDGGDTYFWIYYRDVTAGQTTFTKGIYPTPNLTLTMAFFVNAHVYEFKVTAENLGGEGPASGPVQITSYGGLPQAPSGLTGSAGDGTVHLQWTASATANVLYRVYQRDVTAGQSFQLLPLPTACCVFNGGMLANGHTYEYKVTAENSAGQSTATSVVSVRPMPPLPLAPTGLTATAGNGKMTLRWTATTNTPAWYWIELKSNGGGWQRLPYPVSTCCQFDVGLLANFTTYQVRLFATNMTGDSASPSNTATATPVPPVPSAPSGLTATPGDGKVTLAWTASSTSNVQYWIEVQSGTGAWQRLPYPVNCCTQVVGLLWNGTTYQFRVRATNGYDSGASNTVSARPMPPAPSAPPIVNAYPVGRGQVAVLWSPSQTPNVYYYIYYRLAGDTAWSRLPYPTSQISFIFTQYSYRGELYEFRVSAINLTGEAFSATTKAMVSDVPATYQQHGWNVANGANGVASGIALANGADCEYRGFQITCYNIPWNSDERPWTFGDIFLYPHGRASLDAMLECQAYKRANIRHDTHSHSIADTYGPDVLAHEERHSGQWADYGRPSWVIFALLYWDNPTKWENDANSYWGGYDVYASSSYYVKNGC